MLCYLESTFEVLVGKMYYNWKIVCVYYKESPCKAELSHFGQFVVYRQIY